MFHRNFGLKKTFDVATLETQIALMKAIKTLAFEYKPTHTIESLLNETFLTDRTNKNRNLAKQSAEVMHEAEANAQAIINISRRRLCTSASTETREEWKNFLREVKKVEPELYEVCVPDCIYRGHCYEYVTCGYTDSPEYKQKLEEYRRID